MKLIFTTIIILCLTSCQLLRKDKLTLKRLNQKEELQVTEQRNIVSQQSHLVIIDSNHQDYTMMLWPKGHFKFTVANGFEGEAEKILIMGKHTNQKITTLESKIKRDSTFIKADYSSQQESSTIVKKDKTSLGFSWWWLLIIPVCYIIYLLYKRYRQVIG